MTGFLFILVVIVLASLLAALRDVYDDGYGHRPPPSSHHDPFDPLWPTERGPGRPA